MADRTLAEDRPRAQVGRPRRLVLDDHGPLQGVEVVRSGVRFHAPVVSGSQVPGEFRCRDGGADVPGQGTHEQPHALRIPADAVHPLECPHGTPPPPGCDWPAGRARAANPRFPGHPPRQMSSAISPRGIVCCPAWGGSPSSMRFNEMEPEDRPASCSDMGRKRSRTMRRIPVCRVASSAGMADPVRMNWPGARRSSTARLTWFQILGSSCHSSMRRGGNPFNTSAGSASARCRASSSTSSRDFARGKLSRGRGLAATPNALDHHATGGTQEFVHLQIHGSGEVSSHGWALRDGELCGAITLT